MVLAGKKQEHQSTPEEVGQATARVLRDHVPHELAGVVFLSGGQSVQQATDNLQAVTNCGPFPWPVTFSYARALQDPALFAWKGDNSNADIAASAIAAKLNAKKLILMTDVRGLLRDKDDEDTLISVVNVSEVPRLKNEGIISGGMIPKIDCCVEAVRQGVDRAHILDGRIPHSILIELFSDEGIGTMFY